MTLICNNCRNAYCREPVDGRFEPCSAFASPLRCLFCAQTGVHDCDGGEVPDEYWSRRLRLNGVDTSFSMFHHVTSERHFPGKIDADAFYALPEIDPPTTNETADELVEQLYAKYADDRDVDRVVQEELLFGPNRGPSLDELQAFFGDRRGYFFRQLIENEMCLEVSLCTDKVLALVAEARRFRDRVDELEELERIGERVRSGTLAAFMNDPLDEPDDVDKLHARIHALESAGAAAFNAWRTADNVVGPMHVLREVVGAEFVDEQRKLSR